MLEEALARSVRFVEVQGQVHGEGLHEVEVAGVGFLGREVLHHYLLEEGWVERGEDLPV